jgi:hypothetical protein
MQNLKVSHKWCTKSILCQGCPFKNMYKYSKTKEELLCFAGKSRNKIKHKNLEHKRY